ncbi:AMP-binding protein [Treponema putidum]|uniref:AMP-binding protein n=1 Tax=Treponema putidum TaxID=221027 RepID=UPI0021055E98|nr:AMP-binding protein [Treponema putidum]UTY32289.1 acetyl-CoA synthetase [Treponema putidum]
MFYKEYINYIESNDWETVHNSFSVKAPENFNFAYDVIDRMAKEYPETEALVWCDETEERIFSFAELAKQINKAANFFKAMGIGRGDTVLLFLRRRYEFWFVLPALHKIGAIAVPATVQLASHDIEYRIQSANIKMVMAVQEKNLQEEIQKAAESAYNKPLLVWVHDEMEGWISFDKLVKNMSDDFTSPQGDAYPCGKDTALLYFTSGTSGNPKMVEHNFLYPLGHIATAKFWQNVKEGGRHLSVAETGWAKAMWGKIYGQWLCGCSVFVYDMKMFIPKNMLEKLSKYKITSFCAPPTVYRYLIREKIEDYDLSSLEECTTAGEALTMDIFNTFKEKTGIDLREGYGQTELTLTTGTFPGMKIKPGSMGKPAPGYEIDIIRPDGSSCEAGESGEIILRLDKKVPFGMFGGYYKNAEKTAEVFKGGVYHTGDAAYRDEDGYFWFEGRTDDLIKSSGFRISPFEVESVLLQHPAVFECAVTGVPDPKRGQAVKAFVVLNKTYKPSQSLEKELMFFAKKNAALYKAPRSLEFVETLPKTHNGKISRAAIRNRMA